MKRIICLLVLLPVLLNMSTAYAMDKQFETVIDKNSLIYGLDDDERDISGVVKLDGSYDVKASMSKLYKHVLERAAQKLKTELGYGVELIALAVLCAVANSFCVDKRMGLFINTVSCCAASLMFAGEIDSLVEQACQAMLKLSDYSKAAMPAIFSAAAASGAPASSAAKYAAASLSIDILISVAHKFIVPLVKLYICVAISRSLFDNSILAALSRFIKWAVTSSMTLMTMVFTAYISFTGLISGSVDAAAVKTARTVIANGLPIVGKLISDVSSVILAGAGLVKNSAGVISLIAVCVLCAAPFVDLMVKVFVFKGAAAAADMLPSGKLSGLINDFGTAFSMLLGLIGCCGIMLFVSIISGIKVLV